MGESAGDEMKTSTAARFQGPDPMPVQEIHDRDFCGNVLLVEDGNSDRQQLAVGPLDGSGACQSVAPTGGAAIELMSDDDDDNKVCNKSVTGEVNQQISTCDAELASLFSMGF